jgi:hypothetical protein
MGIPNAQSGIEKIGAGMGVMFAGNLDHNGVKFCGTKILGIKSAGPPQKVKEGFFHKSLSFGFGN